MSKVLAVMFGLVVCTSMACWTALEIAHQPKAADGVAGASVPICMLLAVGAFFAWVLHD